MLVLGIETSTRQTTVAVGTEQGIVAAELLSTGAPNHEVVVPTIDHLMRAGGLSLGSLGGIAVSLGPGLFTGMRVGVATAKALAQALGVPIIGMASLDLVAFAVRHSRRTICATLDAGRRELFYAFYRPMPGGVARLSGFEVGSADRLAGDLEALRDEILVVGIGGLVYRRQLEETGNHVEFGSVGVAFPSAASLVELAVPRFQREDFDRLYNVRPIYVRKSDAEIAWDKRRRAG